MNSTLTERKLSTTVSTSQELMWWTKLYTKNPFCIYYFGPFEQAEEARKSQYGYIEDLENEDATVVFVKILQINPQDLTVEYKNKNLSWAKWLHEMMQDTLMLKLIYEPEVPHPVQPWAKTMTMGHG
jgi:hypothetical protein